MSADPSFCDQAYWAKAFRDNPHSFKDVTEEWRFMVTDAADRLQRGGALATKALDSDLSPLTNLLVAFGDSELPSIGAEHLLDVFRQLSALKHGPSGWAGPRLSFEEMEASIYEAVRILNRMENALWMKTGNQEVRSDGIVTKADSPNHKRNQWMYEQWQAGKTWTTIRDEMAAVWREHGWYKISTWEGVRKAVSEHAKRNGFPIRKGRRGRPS